MALKLIEKFRRHSSVASGNFAAMFKDVEIPPLPAAAASLIAEINRPDPDMGRLVKVISSSPGTSAKVIQTVNSSLFALPNPVLSVQHAVSLLGLRHIRPIALSYALVEAVPAPEGDLFNHEGFWSDSLLRAMLARSFAARHCRGEEENAFTAMLISDIALPVLLEAWGDYYAPVMAEWRESTRRLSAIERHRFHWDHAQAGAWILQTWDFPEELVCFVGFHNIEPERIQELELQASVALPIAVASMAPSGFHPDQARARMLVRAAMEAFSMKASQVPDLIAEVQTSFNEIRELFDLGEGNANSILEDILAAASREDEQEVA